MPSWAQSRTVPLFELAITIRSAPAGAASTARDMKKRYGIQEIPVVYLFDSTGTVTHAHVGFKEEHVAELDAAVRAAMAGGRR